MDERTNEAQTQEKAIDGLRRTQSGVKLILTFLNSSGTSTKLTYGYADKEATAVQIGSLKNVILANNTIFANPPASYVDAEIVETVVYPVNLNP